MISSSRADYKITSNLIKKIKNHKDFKLNLIITGSHLSKKFGLTVEMKYNVYIIWTMHINTLLNPKLSVHLDPSYKLNQVKIFQDSAFIILYK